MAFLEAKTSVHIDSSEIHQVEKQAGLHAVPVTRDTYRILVKAQEISEITEGAFDVTIGAIKELWKFDSDHPEIPNSFLIRSFLSKVNYKYIHFQDSCIFLSQPGMQIDLGGVAKGYIIDRGVAILQNAGIQSGIMDAGGDMRIFGKHPNRDLWHVGIQHPRGQRGDLLAELRVPETSIATSGDYERFFQREGIRYHHILDPKTGLPARDCISVTIVSETALMADAFATGVFVLGPEKGMALIEKQPSLEGVIVFEEEGQLRVLVSKGLKQNVFFHK
jgi:thiamine biosynthesis lipoprotein